MLIIRPETQGDKTVIRHINEEAFGGAVEADIIEKLHSRRAFTLSLVAICDSRVAGHILFSPVTIESEGRSFTTVGLGPMAVLPAYQKTGIGSQLVRAGLEECKRLGHEIVIVLGHPDYLPAFRFCSSQYVWHQMGTRCPR